MEAVKVDLEAVKVDLVKQLILTSSIDSLTASLTSFRSYVYSCGPAYNTLHQLAQITLTIAASSAESEQSCFAFMLYQDSSQKYNGIRPPVSLAWPDVYSTKYIQYIYIIIFIQHV